MGTEPGQGAGSALQQAGFYPQGLGTKEGVIIEILASRTKNQLQEIMKAYEEGKGPAGREGVGTAMNFGSLAGIKGQAVY